MAEILIAASPPIGHAYDRRDGVGELAGLVEEVIADRTSAYHPR